MEKIFKLIYLLLIILLGLSFWKYKVDENKLDTIDIKNNTKINQSI